MPVSMTLSASLLASQLSTFRAPVLALAVAVLGRFVAPSLLPGVALALGWLAGGVALGPALGWASVAALGWPPHGMAARLAICGVAILLLTSIERRLPRRLTPVMPALLGCLGGWWLGGGAIEPSIVPLVVAGGVLGLITARLMHHADEWSRLAGCATLGPALLLLGAPAGVAALALVPGAASFGQIGARASPLAQAAGLAATQFAAALSLSQIRDGHVDAYGLACLAPLVTLWLGPRAVRAAPVLAGLAASVVALGLAVALAWLRRHGGH